MANPSPTPYLPGVYSVVMPRGLRRDNVTREKALVLAHKNVHDWLCNGMQNPVVKIYYRGHLVDTIDKSNVRWPLT